MIHLNGYKARVKLYKAADSVFSTYVKKLSLQIHKIKHYMITTTLKLENYTEEVIERNGKFYKYIHPVFKENG